MEAHLATHLASHPQATLVEDAGELPVGQDLVYPLGRGAYAHIRRVDDAFQYQVIEPTLPPEQASMVADVREKVASMAARLGDKRREGSLEDGLAALVQAVAGFDRDHPVTYRVVRDMAGYGPIDALLRDPNIEDIHLVGLDDAYVIHRRFGMIKTNMGFTDALGLVRFLRLLTERLGRPANDASPIIDAVLEDGSRLNLVYSEDVSRRGPSLSIRRAQERPITITQLIESGTISSLAAAYLWLCLEHGMSMFLCGEAACGKTTTLNAVLPFIDPRSKIYSAEDTPEVKPPHRIWQRLLTRETGPEHGRVRMFDLLKAALRSRPDYILVGEIRGAEGAVAFQAMQTGHPTIATFHARDPQSLVQRLGAPPIQVPMSFMDNLNIVLFQESVRVGNSKKRRVTKIVEIAGSTAEGIVTIPVFDYDPAVDKLVFKGRNNSYILEEKIANLRGLAEPRAIYPLVEGRAAQLDALRAEGRLDAAAVHELLGHHGART